MTDAQPFGPIGKRLRAAREARKMSQGELADLVGVSRQAVVLWEIGKTEPGAAKLHKAADELGVADERVLTGEGDGPDSSPGRAAIRAMIRTLERKLESL